MRPAPISSTIQRPASSPSGVRAPKLKTTRRAKAPLIASSSSTIDRRVDPSMETDLCAIRMAFRIHDGDLDKAGACGVAGSRCFSSCSARLDRIERRLSSAPPNIIGTRKTTDLPPPLRIFRERKPEVSSGAGHERAFAHRVPATELRRRDCVRGRAGREASRRAEGRRGTLPLTWLVDQAPLTSSPHRREAFLKPPGPGFVQITVVDAEGHSDRTQIRLH